MLIEQTRKVASVKASFELTDIDRERVHEDLNQLSGLSCCACSLYNPSDEYVIRYEA